MAEAKKEKDATQKSFKWEMHYRGMEAKDIADGFLNKLEYNIAKDKYSYTPYDCFLSLSYATRDRLVERWITTQQQYHDENVKRVYYLSLEFLMGRLLENNITNLGIKGASSQAMEALGLSYEDIVDQEFDAGLGNGGLGRLAACFLDSMATMELPAIGYGIRYEFGIFNQKIVNGNQVEYPEQWLSYGNPWEIERPEFKYRIRFYGRTQYHTDKEGKASVYWDETEDIFAIPYDTPVPGFKNNTVNTLRLWSARPVNEFDLGHFNSGDYIGACTEKLSSENISKVLYPNDNNHSGKELRLKQQYFFTSASLQDIVRRFLKHNETWDHFSEKNAIQLNDTHPSIAIVELMRILLDENGLTWDQAWVITEKTFAYTNHTLMPEALEKWSVSLMKNLLPRHMELIYEINYRFLRLVSFKFHGDVERLRRMSLIEEGSEPMVRMAYLAIAGSHSVNGVAALHTKLLCEGLVRDFYEMWPEKFNNKTNGITQRRWLYKSNPELTELITEKIGDGWVKDLSQLKKLENLADDKAFQKVWMDVKHTRKVKLAEKLKKWNDIDLDPNMLFDVQVKRIHEYKRQLLKVLHAIHLYNAIKSGKRDMAPRTILIGGKAAPGYFMAKLIIKFVNSVADVINNDPDTKGLLRLHFVPNYRVSLAEYIMPATDVSEQISTAGTEASGTGNMKFALNGGLTVGTMDGANIEMWEEIGDENFFIFGMNAQEVAELWANGYNPQDWANKNLSLKHILELIRIGFFSPEDPELFMPIYNTIMYRDTYAICADFESYVKIQEKVDERYRNREEWARMSILNVARVGKFSSDRTIGEYANEVWGVKPCSIKFPNKQI